jgi:hypothetical protein
VNNDGIVQIGNGLHEGSVGPLPQVTSTAPSVTKPPSTIVRAFPRNDAPGGTMPVVLAIIAIIALSLVTATYARLYLLRREV